MKTLSLWTPGSRSTSSRVSFACVAVIVRASRAAGAAVSRGVGSSRRSSVCRLSPASRLASIRATEWFPALRWSRRMVAIPGAPAAEAPAGEAGPASRSRARVWFMLSVHGLRGA